MLSGGSSSLFAKHLLNNTCRPQDEAEDEAEDEESFEEETSSLNGFIVPDDENVVEARSDNSSIVSDSEPGRADSDATQSVGVKKNGSRSAQHVKVEGKLMLVFCPRSPSLYTVGDVSMQFEGLFVFYLGWCEHLTVY